MDKITLRNGNVVKEVESDDRAKALEEKGFVRDGAAPAITAEDTKALEKELQKAREELTRASEVMETADKRRGELEAELAETKEKLKEASEYAETADKKIEALTQELEGTKEQLEAAVKKNTASKK